MEIIKVTKELENPLFKRKETEVLVKAEITPSHEQVLQLLSEKFSSKPETIKIKGIYGSFGSKEFKILANIYASKKDKESIEPKSKKEAELEKKKIEAQKPKEEAKPEKPTEEPKEEIKQEVSEQATAPKESISDNKQESSEPSGEAK